MELWSAMLALFLVSQLLLGLFLWLKVKDLYKYPNLFGTPVIGNLFYFYWQYGFWGMKRGERYLRKVTEGKDLLFTFVHGRRALILSDPFLIEKIAYNPNISNKPTYMYGNVNPFVEGVVSYCPADKEMKIRKKEMRKHLNTSNIEGPFLDNVIKLANVMVDNMERKPKHVEPFYEALRNTINSMTSNLFGIDGVTYYRRKFLDVVVWVVRRVSESSTHPIFGTLLMAFGGMLEYLMLGRIVKYRTMAIDHLKEQVKKVSVEDSDGSNAGISLAGEMAYRCMMQNRSDRQLNKELNEILASASYTTALTLSAAISFLGVHPEIQEKLWEEQNEIFGSDTRDPTVHDISNMVYLDRFVKETGRFVTPGYIARETSAEIDLDGVKIPAGTMIVFMIGKIHRDPRYWENPGIFDPDHWLVKDRPRFSYIPFGIGVRYCPGSIYATLHIKVAISTIVRRLKLHSEKRFEDLQLEFYLLTEIENPPILKAEQRKLHSSKCSL